ncbi:hypothetical protein [Novosphingobium sp. AAP83]|nr:hypothetical protein [Novosphingobium sp. AAP83]
MPTTYVNSNIALKTPLYAAPVQAEPQRTSPVLSQRELRAIVLQMVG